MIRAPVMDRDEYRSRIVEVSEHHGGQRLDNFLLNQLKGVPRSHIYQLVRTGQVRVNRSRARPKSRLQVGDEVRIPPVRIAVRAPKTVTPSQIRITQRILFEDHHILVLDKPYSIAVHAGSAISAGLIEWLRIARPNAPYLELVHRLDRDTSGCLLIAKSRTALIALQAALRHSLGTPHRLDKYYLALVKGRWIGGARTVTAALEKNVLRSGERLVGVSANGRDAESIFRPLQYLDNATLVEIKLITGRTHQARVHAAHLGHPIAGDTKYGDKAFNVFMRSHGLERLFLHAARLEFRHPVTERETIVSSPLPDTLSAFLEDLTANGD